MSIENPSNNERVDIETMEEELQKKGISFPENWAQFNEESKLRAIESFQRGGLTPLGFATLTPDWFDQVRKVGEKSEKMIQQIDREQDSSKGETLH